MFKLSPIITDRPNIETSEGIMRDNQEQYQAYLVRLWRVDGRSPWRAAVKLAASGEEVNFAGVAELWAYLAEQTAEPPLQSRK